MTKEQNSEPEVLVNEVVVRENGDRSFLAIAIITAAVIVSGTLLYVSGPRNTATTPASSTSTATVVAALPDFPTSLSYPQTKVGDHIVLGNPNAQVTLEEYGDYQCTFCGKFFSETEPLIRQNYVATGKIKVVFKNLIVVDNFVSGGHESHDAALAASCAADQGKFWEYSDAIFTVESKDGRENSGNLTRDLFMRITGKFGMDQGQFAICYDSQKYNTLISSDNKEAAANFKELSTPSFIINGATMQGAAPYSAFKQVIDAALVKAGK
ncbi:MAG: hypothetical protein CO020_00490 [Candidatus Colwellbacteria bacterium CG_4_9_14_0_2_um_filter_50_12]|uniref:C2H2-type domain-containing protein n=1 Tax=Candidatus Colwellbacteria bacterium CG_4_9_14_0_2_um_filter_50_12 TaxID=1974538 RepID=A0A2M8G1E4_9BACT|nr:MAG: hypothetical protein CO020_00490 [Candidatus Colwellbacteria bacterium CG_4_9_14_0_2_um_filter_50_12]